MKARARVSHVLSKENRKQPEEEPQNTEAGENHTYKEKKKTLEEKLEYKSGEK